MFSKLLSTNGHPALQNTPAKISVVALTILRSFFFGFSIYLLNELSPLGTSPGYLAIGAATGAVIATYFSFTRIAHLGFAALCVVVFAFYRFGAVLFSDALSNKAGKMLGGYALTLHSDLFLLCALLAAVSTWFYWKWRTTFVLEVLVVISVSIFLFSGHRNFHFDQPKIVNSLAWDLGLNELTMFVIIGTSLTSLLLLYMYLSAFPIKPNANWGAKHEIPNLTRPGFIRSMVAIVALALCLTTISRYLLSYYTKESQSLIANGVGEAKGEGLSPLGFHAALGSSQQPSALVRLEGDYPENPFSPLLYFREEALSEFNGHEMVRAGAKYDRDVTGTRPEEPFMLENPENTESRSPLVQSIYLLADHKLAFAVDYPRSFKRLANPNRKRFKGAYQADSMAPTFSLRNTSGLLVGDPRWSAEELEHYLKEHPDERYKALAIQIAGNATTHVDQAIDIVQYLSNTAIYTLSPGHEVAKGEDPVAPFLFGDNRGYCVHFAHATVYMLRGLGIPSRIATGYMTDLSQAKDGHILLRMSDRHAWAEIYIQGLGWVAFDTQPKQVESYADPNVDMNLLEELMQMLGPSDEVLPDALIQDEKNVELESRFKVPAAKDLLVPLLFIVMLLALIKAYLRFSWLLPSKPATKLRRTYRAQASALHDLGLRRNFGETRLEYQRRIASAMENPILTTTDFLNQINYGPRNGAWNPDQISFYDFIKRDRMARKILPLWKRLLASTNPSSVFTSIGRKPW